MQKEMWTAGFRYSWRKMTVEELEEDDSGRAGGR